jgi:hypothetical protein
VTGDDELIGNKALKIKIKKISKASKPVNEQAKEKEKLQREKRIA